VNKSVLAAIVAILVIFAIIWRTLPQTWEWHLKNIEPFRAAVQASVWNYVGVAVFLIVAFAAVYWIAKRS